MSKSARERKFLPRLVAVFLCLVLILVSVEPVRIFADETSQGSEEAVVEQSPEEDLDNDQPENDEEVDEDTADPNLDTDPDEPLENGEGDEDKDTDPSETPDNLQTEPNDNEQAMGIIVIPGGLPPEGMDVQPIPLPTAFLTDLKLKTLRAIAPDIIWVDGTPELPLGSVHDFGLLTFGNFTATYSGWGSGVAHMESGVAIAGNLYLYNTYGDFGQAHDHIGNTTIRPHNPRLLIGGDFIETGRPSYASLILHGGDLLMTMGADIGLEFEFIETSTGQHRPDEDGDWMTVPFTDPAVVSNFFTSASHYLNYLNNFFATATRYDEGRIFRGEITPPANPWGQATLNLPENMENYDLIILDLDVSSGNISLPALPFPADFTGNYVINMANHNPVRFASDTSISSPFGLTDIHQVGRHFSHRIIWNFTGSGTITDDYNVVIGSVLAPNADFHAMFGGSVKGAIVVNNFYHGASGFEVHTPTDPNNPPWDIDRPPWVVRPPVEPPPLIPIEPGFPIFPIDPDEPPFVDKPVEPPIITPPEPQEPEPGSPEEPSEPQEPPTTEIPPIEPPTLPPVTPPPPPITPEIPPELPTSPIDPEIPPYTPIPPFGVIPIDPLDPPFIGLVPIDPSEPLPPGVIPIDPLDPPAIGIIVPPIWTLPPVDPSIPPETIVPVDPRKPIGVISFDPSIPPFIGVKPPLVATAPSPANPTPIMEVIAIEETTELEEEFIVVETIEEVPTATIPPISNNPQTNDNNNSSQHAIIAATGLTISVVGLVFAGRRRKKLLQPKFAQDKQYYISPPSFTHTTKQTTHQTRPPQEPKQ
ncbi:MAG: choice-of-anchor A family protein [Defluviitaleaceae bacterium]|nr:choice-of-anchor A family protein [Defluviitaleaceae bacterium]